MVKRVLLAALLTACAAPQRGPSRGADEPVHTPQVVVDQPQENRSQSAHPEIPIPGQCQAHALAPPEGSPRPGHAAAYEADAIDDARAVRVFPPPDESVEPGTRYVEAQNREQPFPPGCGGTNVAWQYVPAAHFRLERVEFHSTYAEAALFTDDCGKPGRALAWAKLAPGQKSGWVGGRFDPPVDVVPNRAYWLWHSSGPCSVGGGGARQVYWGNFRGTAANGWEGPFRSYTWAARFYGTAR